MPELRHITYGGWDNAFMLSNGQLELVITGDVGPRIIRFGLPDAPNVFYEDPATRGQTGGDVWRNYGGHRLWHAPEHPRRTYNPDNSPVTVGKRAGFVRIRQPREATTGISKEIDLHMSDSAAHVRVVHRLRNDGLWPVPMSAWALSVMAGGGFAILPLPPRGEHPRDLLPSSSLVLWPYTDLSDPRWTWGSRYIRVQQADGPPQKIGASVPDGWLAYWRDGTLFVKLFQPVPDVTYPDRGSMAELFTNRVMLEVETLGPLQTVPPDSAIEHTEDWFLFTGVERAETDEAIDRHILPLIRTAQQQASLSG